MNNILNLLVSGLILGALYAIMALGLTIIYGVSRVFNFAHGIIAVIGGYIGWFAITKLGLGFIPGMLISLMFLLIFGWLVYRFFIRPLFNKPNWVIATILFTLGLGILLENVLL